MSAATNGAWPGHTAHTLAGYRRTVKRHPLAGPKLEPATVAPSSSPPKIRPISVDWPAVLATTLRSAAIANSEREFADSVWTLLSASRDGHASLVAPSPAYSALLPLAWAWIDEQLIVTAVAKDIEEKLRPGDAVLSIGGKPTRQALFEAEAVSQGASPQRRRQRAVVRLARGEEGEVTSLEIEPVRTPGTQPRSH